MTVTGSLDSPDQRIAINNDGKLTIDEMLARYPLVEVERAIYHLDYPGYVYSSSQSIICGSLCRY